MRDIVDSIVKSIGDRKKILVCLEPNIASYIILKTLSEKPDIDVRAIIFKFLKWVKPKAIADVITLCNRFKVEYDIFDVEDILALILHRLKAYIELCTAFPYIGGGAVKGLILTKLALSEGRVPIIARSLTDLAIYPEPRFNNLIYPLVQYTDSFLAGQLSGEEAIESFSRKICEVGEIEFPEIDRRLSILQNSSLACEYIEKLFAQPRDLDDLLSRNICILKQLGWDLWTSSK